MTKHNLYSINQAFDWLADASAASDWLEHSSSDTRQWQETRCAKGRRNG